MDSLNIDNDHLFGLNHHHNHLETSNDNNNQLEYVRNFTMFNDNSDNHHNYHQQQHRLLQQGSFCETWIYNNNNNNNNNNICNDNSSNQENNLSMNYLINQFHNQNQFQNPIYQSGSNSSAAPVGSRSKKRKQSAKKSSTVSKSTYKHVPHREKPVHLVARRNARERRRVQAVNMAFMRLRKCVPVDNRGKRLSKVKTLHRAIEYIRALDQLLNNQQESDQHETDQQQQQLQQPCSGINIINQRCSTMYQQDQLIHNNLQQHHHHHQMVDSTNSCARNNHQTSSNLINVNNKENFIFS